MSGAVELITFKADMADLRNELGKLPGISDKEAKAMVRSLERQLKRTEKAAKRTAKKAESQFDKMGRAAKKTGGDFKKMGAAASELSPALGGAFNTLGSFTKLLSVMSNPAVLAAAAVVGLGAAAVGAVYGMVKVTQASEELIEKTEPLQDLDGLLPEMDPDILDSIYRANDAMGALGSVFDAFTLTLGMEFAPYVERGAELLLRLAVMAQESFAEFASGHDIVREFATYLVQEFVQALLGPVDALMGLMGMMGKVASAVGLDEMGERLQGLNDGWESWTHSIASTAVDSWFSAGADAVGWLDEATQEYAGTAEELIEITGRQRRATEAVRDVNAELAELIGGMRAEQLTAEQQILAAYDAQIAKIAELETAGANAHAAQMARNMAGAMAAQEVLDLQYEAAQATVDSTNEALKTATDEMASVFDQLETMVAQSRASIIASAGSMLGSVSDITGQLADRVAESGGKGAMALYRISQAAGISQATIAAYTAFAQALALPLPPPAPQIAAGAALASGLAAVSQIAMTPAPSMAHQGQIAPSTALQPDEMFTGGGTRALRNETILDPSTSERLGGENGVRDLMWGGGGARPILIGGQYKHFDNRVEDLLLTDTRTARQLLAETRTTTRPY